MNKKGMFFTAPVIAAAAIAALLAGTATVKTAKSGTLKRDGKLIWCKMQNKGNDFCDALYR